MYNPVKNTHYSRLTVESNRIESHIKGYVFTIAVGKCTHIDALFGGS